MGLYPLLRVGGWRDDTSRSGASAFAVAAGAEMDGEFVYQSQSGRQPGGAGSFEGELFFVPGSLKRPTGDEFAVRVDGDLVDQGRRTFAVEVTQVEHPPALRIVGMDPIKVRLDIEAD